MKLSRELSERLFDLRSVEDARQWLRDVDAEVVGLRWEHLGGIQNNVHAIEVATDPAAALVERVTNSIDAVLDLMAEKREETAPTPHLAAQKWYGVPATGISEMSTGDRQNLANLITVANLESGDRKSPTVRIRDRGTGQDPDAFPQTLLSLMESNKKSKTHQMGVYNAGGAATYSFAELTAVVSRREPSILDGAADDIGVAMVRYNHLDPDKYKSGTYEYCVGPDNSILRLDLPGGELPDTEWGTHITHFGYELASYSQPAHGPTGSLHHLFHAALPDPALPFWVEEHRLGRYEGLKGKPSRRVISGLLARLKGENTADYQDERRLGLGDAGAVTLRYFVLNDDQNPDAFTTSQQGLSFVLNGQRQGTKDRYWVKRHTGLGFIWRRLVILVDCNELTNAAKREVFASTREQSKDSPLARRILERVQLDIEGDEQLQALDEAARQRVLAAATKSTSDKVKKQLAGQIASMLKGSGPGRKGGGRKPHSSRRGKPKIRDISDDEMLEIPDTLSFVDDPVRIRPGSTASMRLFINAKNGFLPRHEDGLSLVIDASVNQHVRVVSIGKLLGGQVRITLEADRDAPLTITDLRVALVVPSLAVMLVSESKLEVYEPETPEDSPASGGEPDVDIRWVGRDAWSSFEPPWDDGVAGEVDVTRDPDNPEVVTRVQWIFNEAFGPYERVLSAKKVGETYTQKFREAYEYPVCWGMFRQQMAQDELEARADEEGTAEGVEPEYSQAERSRLAEAVLMAMEPGLAAAAQAGD